MFSGSSGFRTFQFQDRSRPNGVLLYEHEMFFGVSALRFGRFEGRSLQVRRDAPDSFGVWCELANQKVISRSQFFRRPHGI